MQDEEQYNLGRCKLEGKDGKKDVRGYRIEDWLFLGFSVLGRLWTARKVLLGMLSNV